MWTYRRLSEKEIADGRARYEQNLRFYRQQGYTQSPPLPAEWMSTQGYVFTCEDHARQFVGAMNEHFAALEELAEVPMELTREDYEAACERFARLGATALDDATTRRVPRRGEYWPRWSEGQLGGYTVAQHVTNELAIRRGRGIEAETPPPPVRQPDYPDGLKLDCGHTVYWRSHVMGANLGSSCPDCYDRMSGHA
jgi:hypothetical protein